MKTFREVDEALYRHEQPFYRACAGGAYFERTRTWEIERAWLLEQWHKLCPYKRKPANGV